MAKSAAIKPTSERYRSFVERVERLEEEKRGLGEDIKVVYAEAKADGFDVKQMRRHIGERRKDSVKRATDQAVLDTYMHALGDINEAPLFKAVGALAVDTAMRDQVIEACKMFVPERDEIILRAGPTSVRIWRDADGDVFAEDYLIEPPRREADHAPEGGDSESDDPELPIDGPIDIEAATEAEAAELGRCAGRGSGSLVDNPFTDSSDPRHKAWADGWSLGMKEPSRGKR